LIVPKLLPGSERLFAPLRALLALARADRKPIVVDICDDHFRLEYFRGLVHEADFLTAPTETMAALVRQHSGSQCTVIPDPFEGLRGAPRVYRDAGGARELRLLWFGARGNLPALFQALPQLVQSGIRCELEIISDGGRDLELASASWNERGGRTLWLTCTEWSPASMREGLEHCDVVVLPAATDDPQKRVKSPNRVIEGLQAGRFVIASPLPSYLEFSSYAWISNDLAEGVRWVIGAPNEALARIVSGQAHIEKMYSPASVAQLWHKLLNGMQAPTHGA
jgi:hypothetical protein